MESLSRETRLDLLEIIGQIMPGGILGGYMEEGFPLYVANERMLRMLGYDNCEEFEQEIFGCILNCIHPMTGRLSAGNGRPFPIWATSMRFSTGC